MKHKVVYLAENLGGYADPTLALSAVMHQSGHNVGNFAFWNAARNLFDADVHCFPFGAKSERLPKDLDFVVIPAANFLNATADLGWLADLIVEIDKPCLVVGLGAQSERDNDIPVLKEGTVRFLQEAAKRTPFLALRGPFSEQVCRRYGVENTRVLGCPSIFTNSDRRMADKIVLHWKSRPVEKIAIHAASIKSHVKGAERFLFSTLQVVHGSSYVIQRPVELMKVARGEPLTEPDHAYLSKVRDFLAPDLSESRFNQVVRATGVVPYSVDSWRFSLNGHSHSLGTRIHGALLSLSSYLPTLCITHDTRTRELCSVLKVPNLPCDQIRATSSARELFASVQFNADEFEDNRSQIAGHYRSLLSSLGMRASKLMSEVF